MVRLRGCRYPILVLAVAGAGLLYAQEAKEARWEKLDEQVLELDKAGKYDEALPLAVEALQEAQASLKPDDPMLALAMNSLGRVYGHQGEYAKAEALDLRAVAIVEKALGPEAPELAPFLINLANVYSSENELPKVEPLLLRVLHMDEKTLKPDSPELAGDLNNLGTIYYQQGKYEKAEPLFEQALKIDTKAAAGEDDAALANDMANLGMLYDQQAKFAEAEPLLKRSLEIDEKVKGADHPDVGMDLVNLGVLYVDEAKYQAAEEVYQHAAEILEKALGPDHGNVAMVLSKLALVDDHLSKYAEAEPLFKRALSIDEKAFGENNTRVAMDLSNLAMLDEHRNQYAEARPLFERALSIDEKALGPDHSDVAIIYDNLGEVDLYQSQFAQAEAHYRQSLKILEKAEGSNHTDVAHTLDDLANLYDAMGRYAEAEQAARRAIAIQEKAEGADHPDVANSLESLATLYLHEGKYAEAEPLVQRELRIREKALGPDHVEVANALNNLAALYYKEGKYADAEPLYMRAFKIDLAALGRDAPGVATDLNNLALNLQRENKYADARELFERALSIDEKALGPNDANVALCLSNLAALYTEEDKFSNAEPLVVRALAIDEKALGPENPEVGTDVNNLAVLYSREGRYSDAEPLYVRLVSLHERLLGPDHPDLATDVTNFGLLYEYQGKYAQAQPLFQRAFDNLFKQFQYNFTYMTEKERLGFLDTVANDFPAYFSFVHRFRDKDPELIGSMYNLLLWEKGFIAGSVADMRRQVEASGDAESLKLLGQLTEKRTQIAALLNVQPQDRDAWQKQIERLRGEADELEKALVARSSAYAQRKKLDRSTWQQVRDALGPGEAAVEFARFRYYDNKWTDKSYYAALVVTRETKDEPEYIFLGENSQLEGDAITHFRQQLQTRGVGVVEEAALPGQDAYGLIWKPLEPVLSGKTRVYLSPDGVLNQLPLGIIAGPDGKLEMEKYDLRLVSSTRDILRPASPHGADTALLVGNPVFALSEEAQRTAEQKLTLPHQEPVVEAASLTGSEVSRDQGTSTTLPPLAGTGAEIDAIAGLMRERQWKTGVYTGDLALKRVVEETSSPRVVHLATHGFFLPDQQVKATQLEAEQLDRQPLGLEDPMLRSGLYFAGADRTLQGKPSAPDVDNGVLTAMEAANLNLHGTELVVLSACNTGQGDVKNGEGVFGLRRALEEAGAQNVLMSLWSVPDQETLELMRRFYAKWLAGTEVHAALQQAQMEMRERVKAAHDGKNLPYYWGAFVLVGR
ncbi:MAG: tetratricopeptide repeat protein [Acidobacteriaceae bacterium]